MNKKALILIGILWIISLRESYSQALWSENDKAIYAIQRSDTSLWDMEQFEGDLQFPNDWPTEPAISDYPSPVPSYDWGYGYLNNIKIEVNGRIIEGKSVGFAKDKYREHLLIDSSDLYINYFNIFIATDLSEDEASSNHISSRNYPHYFSSGKQKTSKGSVDWVQLSLADGANIAVVSQRYFDLNCGRTILAQPLKDGSLRLLQIRDSIGSISYDNLIQDESSTRDPKSEYLNRLSQNKKVISFFSELDNL